MIKTSKEEVRLVQANEQDFISIYGYTLDCPFEAWIAQCGEEILGIAGYIIHDHLHTLFLNITNIRDKKFTISRLILQKLKQLRKQGLQFLIIRDKYELHSNIFLQKLGFRLSYTVDDEEIWADYEVL